MNDFIEEHFVVQSESDAQTPLVCCFIFVMMKYFVIKTFVH